jgi:hypothetical protein
MGMLALLLGVLQGLLLSGSATPSTALSAASYSLSFQRSVTLGASSTIYIQLSTLFLTVNPSGCSMQANGAGAFAGTTCGAATYLGEPAVLFSGLPVTGAVTQLAFQFQLNNPKVANLLTLRLAVIDSTGTTGSEAFSMTFTAGEMTCSVASSAATVGLQSAATQATHTFTITPLVPIVANSFIQVEYPDWFSSTNADNVKSGTTLQCSSPQIAGVTCSANNQVFSTSPTAANITSAVTLALFYLNNPPSQAPFGPLTVGVYDNAENRIVQRCTPSLTIGSPAVFLNLIFQGLNTVISSTATGVNITMQPTNPIPAGTSGAL